MFQRKNRIPPKCKKLKIKMDEKINPIIVPYILLKKQCRFVKLKALESTKIEIMRKIIETYNLDLNEILYYVEELNEYKYMKPVYKNLFGKTFI